MKILRLALFFGAGVYLGLHADRAGDLESFARTVWHFIEHARKFRQ
jgi:hypothetical protein